MSSNIATTSPFKQSETNLQFNLSSKYDAKFSQPQIEVEDIDGDLIADIRTTATRSISFRTKFITKRAIPCYPTNRYQPIVTETFEDKSLPPAERTNNQVQGETSAVLQGTAKGIRYNQGFHSIQPVLRSSYKFIASKGSVKISSRDAVGQKTGKHENPIVEEAEPTETPGKAASVGQADTAKSLNTPMKGAHHMINKALQTVYSSNMSDVFDTSRCESAGKSPTLASFSKFLNQDIIARKRYNLTTLPISVKRFELQQAKASARTFVKERSILRKPTAKRTDDRQDVHTGRSSVERKSVQFSKHVIIYKYHDVAS